MTTTKMREFMPNTVPSSLAATEWTNDVTVSLREYGIRSRELCDS